MKIGSSKQDYSKAFLSVMAPMLALYVKDSEKIVSENESVRHIFLSREGYLLQKAVMHNSQLVGSTLDSSYLEVSRRSLCRLLVAKGNLELRFVTKEHFSGTISQLWTNRFGIPLEIVNQVLDSRKRKERVNPGHTTLISSELSYANTVCPNLMSSEYQEGMQYLEKFFSNPDHNYVIRDVGYSGTMQDLLETILGIKLHGVYLALDNQKNNATNKRGVMPQDITKKILSNTRIFEILFNLGMPTVIGYKLKEGDVHPKYQDETAWKSDFVQYHGKLMEKISELVSLPEPLLISWVRANYPSSLADYFSSSEGEMQLNLFEDLWSGGTF